MRTHRDLEYALKTYEEFGTNPKSVPTKQLRRAVRIARDITHSWLDRLSGVYSKTFGEDVGRDFTSVTSSTKLQYDLALREGTRESLAIALDKFWHDVHVGQLVEEVPGLEDEVLVNMGRRLDKLATSRREEPFYLDMQTREDRFY